MSLHWIQIVNSTNVGTLINVSFFENVLWGYVLCPVFIHNLHMGPYIVLDMFLLQSLHMPLNCISLLCIWTRNEWALLRQNHTSHSHRQSWHALLPWDSGIAVCNCNNFCIFHKHSFYFCFSANKIQKCFSRLCSLSSMHSQSLHVTVHRTGYDIVTIFTCACISCKLSLLMNLQQMGLYFINTTLHTVESSLDMLSFLGIMD